MANTKGQTGNDWPTQPFNKLIDEDPQIVKVPMTHMDWGSRESTMKKVQVRNDGLNVKNIPNEGGKGK